MIKSCPSLSVYELAVAFRRNGQLGIGNTVNQNDFMAVSGSSERTQVATGNQHTCTVRVAKQHIVFTVQIMITCLVLCFGSLSYI
jgi:hypothetical protein